MESSASASVVLSQTKATKAAAAAALVTRLNKDLETEEDQENAK